MYTSNDLSLVIVNHIEVLMQRGLNHEQATDVLTKVLASNIVGEEIGMQADFVIEEEGYTEEKPLKHKEINLTEFKQLFPEYKISRKVLQNYITEHYPNPLHLNNIEIKIHNHGRGIYADFVKDNYIYHLSC